MCRKLARSMLAGSSALVFTVGAASAVEKRFTGAVSQNWLDGANWDPAGVPAASDDVILNMFVTATLNATVTVATFTLSSGTLTGSGTLNVTGLVTWTDGTMSGSGVTNAMAGMDLGGGFKAIDARTVNLLGGTATMSSPNSFISVANGAVFNNQGTFVASNDSGLSGGQGFFGIGTFNNMGTFRKSAGNTGFTEFSQTIFNNSGTVEILSGTLRVTA